MTDKETAVKETAVVKETKETTNAQRFVKILTKDVEVTISSPNPKENLDKLIEKATKIAREFSTAEEDKGMYR